MGQVMERCAAAPRRPLPVPGALEPVEDVGAAGVVDLVEWMGVGLLHRHRIAAQSQRTSHHTEQTSRPLTFVLQALW